VAQAAPALVKQAGNLGFRLHPIFELVPRLEVPLLGTVLRRLRDHRMSLARVARSLCCGIVLMTAPAPHPLQDVSRVE
jgi:hypothetical protein